MQFQKTFMQFQKAFMHFVKSAHYIYYCDWLTQFALSIDCRMLALATRTPCGDVTDLPRAHSVFVECVAKSAHGWLKPYMCPVTHSSSQHLKVIEHTVHTAEKETDSLPNSWFS